MRCTTDRIRRAVCFEIIGILTVTPIFARMFGHPMGNMGRGARRHPGRGLLPRQATITGEPCPVRRTGDQAVDQVGKLDRREQRHSATESS
ncbi:chlorhexidine efflux transporter [Thioclava nitratireducens]|uniref:chlorhexidine efflux transporter n=1 Tax=Thioclava nitratireducens TaxID=1915078 RepID=UPI0012FDCD3E|nr:chlorhexidine efflux transporter [Thioclava nitratireducens]